MSLFKKKIRTVGKGADTIVTLRKKIEELNYTPVDYKYTVQYAEFINGAEEQFRKMIDKISVDDLCESMLDAYINSNIEQMKASAAEQKTYHMHAI